jgi:hypothetical protein
MLINKCLPGLKRRSSSAGAKYADALRRIALAWRSSRTSRSYALMRSASLLIEPFASLLAFCDCLSQRRNISAIQPIWAEMD